MSIALRNRAENVIEWLNNYVSFAGGVHTRRDCTRIVLRNLQHVRRGTIDDVLHILRNYKSRNYINEVTNTIDAIIKEVERL